MFAASNKFFYAMAENQQEDLWLQQPPQWQQ
jgi:hypothetical protein